MSEIITRETFARRFRCLRMDGETQSQFADRIGLTQPTIALYESGKRSPDIETLARICRVCRCSADWLIGLADVNIMSDEARGRKYRERYEKTTEATQVVFTAMLSAQAALCNLVLCLDPDRPTEEAEV